MFNIGFGELAVICIVLIIAVGPERLPSMMKTLGKTIRTLRQASRDIRASTGIDEMMREDFDLYAPIKPSPPRRPAIAARSDTEIEPAALPSSTVSDAVGATDPELAKPVSREEVIDDEGRPSVVVAPPPQSVGLPSDEPAAIEPPTGALTEVSAPAPQLTAAADPSVLPEVADGANAAISSNVDTLPRAPIVQPATAAAKSEPQPEAATNGAASSEPKQSGA
jgi:sec-independent protein translocase protein TatB